MTEYTLLLLDLDKRGTGFCLVPEGTAVPDLPAIQRWEFASTAPYNQLTRSLGRLATWIAGSGDASCSPVIDDIVDRWIDLVGDESSLVLSDKRTANSEVMQ